MTSNDEAAQRAIDALTAAFFKAVSFEQGGKPSYQDLRAIFIERGLLIKNVSGAPEVATVDEFIAPRQRMVDTGEMLRFEEVETAHITEIFGNVAQRFSTYRKRGLIGGAEVVGQGVISIQFVLSGGEWKMSAMAWDDERPGLSIPDRYRSSRE